MMAGVQTGRDFYYEYRSYLNSLGGDNSAACTRLVRNLRRAMAEELTEKERRAVELYYIDGVKMVEIARITGVNPSTVSRSIKRAKRKLRRALRYGARELLEEEREDF